MPRRPSFDRPCPHTSSNAVNEVLGLLSRKLATQYIDTAPQPTQIRRGSISGNVTGRMDSLLHPMKKSKKRGDSEERDARDKKRSSLAIRPAAKSKERTTPRNGSVASPGLKPQPCKFEMIMESPPTIFHGSTNYSAGALLSGRLKLNVEDPSGEVRLTKFNMVLQVETSTKKPVHKECRECTNKHETIREFKFLSEPKSFYKMGDNQFPWSHLLEGRLPATTHCQLGSITYSFIVNATTSSGEKITFTHPLHVSRAVPPGPDKASIRIFPPTHLTGRVNMPPVVHPIGKFPVSLSLSGVIEKKEQSQTRWRLKKMMWRIEENSKVKSVPCDKHKAKVSEGKAVQHSDSKQLGSGELKTGWKTDFDTAGGEIMLDFEAQLSTKPSHKPTCDVDSQSGLEVKHNLIVELIVAEEFVPNKNTNLITPTGAARVLRMQFALIVSDRAGMGISWEDEMPPMYEDVPPSPPGYGSADKNDGAFGGAIMEDYHGPDLEYTDLVRIHTSDPSDPPVYRQREWPDIDVNQPTTHRHGAEGNDGAGPSQPRIRLGGFRLDELEEEPQYVPRRRVSDQEDEAAVDFGEGSAGAAPVEQSTRRAR